MKDQPTRKNNNRVVAAIVIVVIILAALGVHSYIKQRTAQPVPPAPSNQTILPEPKTLSHFTLTDDEGKTFTNDNLKNHWTLMAFGFSHCGDVCPITLTELNKMYQLLQKDMSADQLPQVVFISVDPERDTTSVLHNYIKNYNPNFIAANGDQNNLDIFTKEMGVYYSKKPSSDPQTYGMEHSSQLFVFNPEGEWVGVLSFPFKADELVQSYKNMSNSR